MKVLLQNTFNSKIFDITSLISEVNYTTSLSEQPGTLKFIIQKDPNELLQINNGSIINFKFKGKNIFYGYVFNIATDMTETYSVTAYDQMRYLKYENSMYTGKMTASELFKKICIDNEFKYKIVTPSKYIIPEFFHDKKTLFSIIQKGIMYANINESKQYYIRDNIGVLEFIDHEKTKTNLVIGEKSLLTSYQFETSIDKDTYNYVKVVRQNDKTKKLDIWLTTDSSTVKRWGKLQYLQEAEKEMNKAQIIELSNNILKQKNKETQSMKLTALGVSEIIAGSGFLLQIDSLNIKQFMSVLTATHTFTKDLHMMDLEVYI